MEAIPDFEDMLGLLEKHGARYVIIGGLAFIFHAKPRYTKDMDIWIDPSLDNVSRTNAALTEFGSPFFLTPEKPSEITQVGMPPHRIDFLREVEGLAFEEVWPKRIRAPYGQTTANWIDLDSLIQAKSLIDTPRHQDDARVLRQVKEMRSAKRGST